MIKTVRITTLLVAFSVLGAVAGCATTSSSGAIAKHTGPTHRWHRDDASETRYNVDNRRCLSASELDIRHARRGAAEFLAYEECMVAKGYALRELAPLIVADRHPG